VDEPPSYRQRTYLHSALRMDNVEVAYLADHAALVVELAAALHAQDREYYGARPPADVAADLALSLQREALPLALIALRDGVLLGTATLRHDSITTHAHLGPWLTAFYVRPELRGRGIGGKLVAAIEAAAQRLGFAQLYAGSGRAASLFQRAGWQVLECVSYHGEEIAILRRDLR
jgi:GNAT superfamily N-acetyltransferase